MAASAAARIRRLARAKLRSIAVRRRRAGLLTGFILWAALTAPALAQLPRMPQTPEGRRFYALVQRAIYQVTPGAAGPLPAQS
jgi:hypothetical protein